MMLSELTLLPRNVILFRHLQRWLNPQSGGSRSFSYCSFCEAALLQLRAATILDADQLIPGAHNLAILSFAESIGVLALASQRKPQLCYLGHNCTISYMRIYYI